MTSDIDALLTRGVAEVLVESELRDKLASGRKLRLKQGFDPSRPQMTIGNGVGLRKLRKFQEHGHTAVLIVGDWTAQIGDPSGRDESRPRLDAATVKQNAETYMQQFFSIVDRERTEVRWQSEWFGGFTLENALNLAGRFTLGQMLAHETFRKRYEAGAPLTILELMYPMLQGYDSVAVQSDVEFGGTDQKFNNLAGRQLQEQWGQTPQDILLVPLIPGTDGRKMSKSFDNSVDMNMPPDEKYGKLMSMSDDVLPLYYEVWTDVPMDEIREMQRAIKEGGVNPRDLKMRLAREIIGQIDGAQAAAEAEEHFVRVHQQRALPDEIPTHELQAPTGIVDVLVAAGMAATKSEARRLIAGGGVRVGGERVEGTELTLQPGAGAVVQVGRRRFVRVV
jgi:tyrosyl-tRNA synthetase